MAAITYTIKNLSSTNQTAIIRAFEITTNPSQIQHHLDLSGWNAPYNTYTDFTGTSTRITINKTFQGDVKDINLIIESFTGTNQITFTEPLGTLGSNWTPQGAPFQSNQTIASLNPPRTVVFTGSFDQTPVIGNVITFSPPNYLLFVNNVTGLDVGWTIVGNGYSGQTIEQINPPDTLRISGPASTEPVIGQPVGFVSDNDNMWELGAGASKTFVMDYNRVTSTLGTYTSLVKIYADLGSTEVIKNVNNFMIISPNPVTNPDSPYYSYGGDGGGGPGPDCGDSASGAGCSI